MEVDDGETIAGLKWLQAKTHHSVLLEKEELDMIISYLTCHLSSPFLFPSELSHSLSRNFITLLHILSSPLFFNGHSLLPSLDPKSRPEVQTQVQTQV